MYIYINDLIYMRTGMRHSNQKSFSAVPQTGRSKWTLSRSPYISNMKKKNWNPCRKICFPHKYTVLRRVAYDSHGVCHVAQLIEDTNIHYNTIRGTWNIRVICDSYFSCHVAQFIEDTYIQYDTKREVLSIRVRNDAQVVCPVAQLMKDTNMQ